MFCFISIFKLSDIIDKSVVQNGSHLEYLEIPNLAKSQDFHFI